MTDESAQRKRAVKWTLPVFCGYIFLGIAFGATLAQAGFGVPWALAISTFVYAGSLQFVMVPFLAGGTSLIAVALTAAALYKSLREGKTEAALAEVKA